MSNDYSFDSEHLSLTVTRISNNNINPVTAKPGNTAGRVTAGNLIASESLKARHSGIEADAAISSGTIQAERMPPASVSVSDGSANRDDISVSAGTLTAQPREATRANGQLHISGGEFRPAPGTVSGHSRLGSLATPAENSFNMPLSEEGTVAGEGMSANSDNNSAGQGTISADPGNISATRGTISANPGGISAGKVSARYDRSLAEVPDAPLPSYPASGNAPQPQQESSNVSSENTVQQNSSATDQAISSDSDSSSWNESVLNETLLPSHDSDRQPVDLPASAPSESENKDPDSSSDINNVNMGNMENTENKGTNRSTDAVNNSELLHGNQAEERKPDPVNNNTDDSKPKRFSSSPAMDRITQAVGAADRIRVSDILAENPVSVQTIQYAFETASHSPSSGTDIFDSWFSAAIANILNQSGQSESLKDILAGSLGELILSHF